MIPIVESASVQACANGGLTQGLASYLPTATTDFFPGSCVQFARTVTKLTSESDNFSNDQLRNASRIAERGVEDSDTMLRSKLSINLIGAYAKASNNK